MLPRSAFSVRNSLLAITGLSLALLVWLVTSFWLEAYIQRRDAVRISRSTDVSGFLLDSATAWSAERLLTHVALNQPDPASGSVTTRLAALRRESDRALAVALEEILADPVTDGAVERVARVKDHLRDINRLRGMVDQAVSLPVASRAAGVAESFFPEITALIMEVERLKVAVRYRPASPDEGIETYLDVDHAVYVMNEFAERERALIAGKIASGAALSFEDIGRLSDARGHFDEAWRMMEAFSGQGRAAESLIADTPLVRGMYFGTFDDIRRAVIEAGRAGTPYPIGLEDWIAKSDLAISPIWELGGMASMISNELAAGRAARGGRDLAIDTVILALVLVIGGLAIWIVIFRIARPLERITTAMTRLATGQEIADVPETGRAGEIGEMAQSVQVFKETLEDRIRQRTLEATTARDAAIEANLAKSSFLANMSHELRTPLHAIIGYSEILAEEAEELGEGEFLEDLERIQSAGRQLLGLINDVLDLSRIEAGKLKLNIETFEIAGIIQDARITAEPLADSNNNTLIVDMPDDIGAMNSDRTKVLQALVNILTNAAKFTTDGEITLQVRRRGSSGAQVIDFSVADTGIGMTPEQLEKIFNAFTQADNSTTREFGGSGLGLAITRGICTVLGGDVRAESTPGAGSRFIITLPAEMSYASAAAERNDERAAPAPDWASTVLVIDDDAVARDLLRRHLSQHGYRTVNVSDGESGIAKAQELKPDAITLDVLMPGMNGWTVLSRLKEDPETADIPVAIVSMVDDRKVGFSLGAVDFITKPIDRDRLLSVIAGHCLTGKRRPRALIIEDEPGTRDVLRRILMREAWDVSEAEHGAAGLNYLGETVPDIILLDLMMPVMDGFEFLKAMRDNEAWAGIPVIVVTAKELNGHERRMLDGRIQQLIEKGDHLESVLATLRELLPNFRAPVHPSAKPDLEGPDTASD